MELLARKLAVMIRRRNLMNEYFFQQRINTIAETWEPFEFKGFRFEAHKIDWINGSQSGWVASKSLVENDVDTALKILSSELNPLVDKISFVTQCFAVIALESFLIKRPDRPEFFLRLSRDRGHVPLHFGDQELESLEALEEYEEKGDAFRYLREAINSPDYYARFAMLVSSLEGIAGEKKKDVTNRDYIKNTILKDETLYNNIFLRGNGIRNQLLHGKKIDLQLHGGVNYVDIIYKKIVDYFNNNHGANIKTNVINAPRNILLNYEIWRGWLTPLSEENRTEIVLENFAGLDLHEATKNFKTIDKPDDY